MSTRKSTRHHKIAVKRHPERGSYDQKTIYNILDEGYVCHLAVTIDDEPVVLPTGYCRINDYLYLHGAASNRLLNQSLGKACCLSITLLDGMVLARSAFHHSMNYRSVVVFAVGEEVIDVQLKLDALQAFTEHMVPGRWKDVRPPTSAELAATRVVRFHLKQASAKIRTGPPKDHADDVELPVWAGCIPMQLSFGTPEPDEFVPDQIVFPEDLAKAID